MQLWPQNGLTKLTPISASEAAQSYKKRQKYGHLAAPAHQMPAGLNIVSATHISKWGVGEGGGG